MSLHNANEMSIKCTVSSKTIKSFLYKFSSSLLLYAIMSS